MSGTTQEQNYKEKALAIQNLQQSKQRVEDEDLAPFFSLQKSQVLHEAKIFSDTPLDTRKCCSVLTELLCLISQGETFTNDEVTPVFFGCTKLFQSNDPNLRRLLYLVLQELSKMQEQAWVVIASLEKDINSNIDLFRANALRVHSKVIDNNMLEQRSRLFRQAIVNKNEHISSSALCAGIRLYDKIDKNNTSNKDVIKRWVNEVKDSCKSNKSMVSFHGLNLLYKINSNDKQAIIRLVSSMIVNPPESTYAKCLLIRYCFNCIKAISNKSDPPKRFLNFIKEQIKNYKNPMIMFEAAKALSHLPKVTDNDLIMSMNVLQEFLNSTRSIQRFAAVRALTDIVNKNNNILTPSCIVDLEQLITDPNRNIATLSITTLLKTTAEYSIDRLLNSITDFMTEISDELKIILIDSINNVCEKFPNKYECLLSFLSMALREEGGFIYKSKIVDCMLILMNKLQRAKEFGLDSLCEFIEDCEYPQLSVRILHLIGQLASKTSNPARYIRFIYNRVLLELPSVRSAAVSCLAKCAVDQVSLKNDIQMLVGRSINDVDDEVRDRATIYNCLMDNFVPNETEQKNDITQPNDDNDDNDDDDDDEVKENVLSPEYTVPNDMINIINVDKPDFGIKQLEISLLDYIASNDGQDNGYENEFTKELIKEEKIRDLDQHMPKDNKKKPQGIWGNEMPEVLEPDLDSQYIELLTSLKKNKKNIPELGKELTKSNIELLTEEEAEYQVEVVKRVYKKYIVLQFQISTSLPKQIIKDVYVKISYDDTELTNFTCPYITKDKSGNALTIIERENDDSDDDDDDDDDDEDLYILGEFEASLKFINIDDVDINDDDFDIDNQEGYEDEYPLNEIVFRHVDYVTTKKLNPDDDDEDNIREFTVKEFKKIWGELDQSKIGVKPSQRKGSINNIQKKTAPGWKYDKHSPKLQNVIDYAITCVGLYPIDDSDKLKTEDSTQHVCNLIGKTSENQYILLRMAFVQDSNNNSVSFRVAGRSKNPLIAKAAVRSI